MNRVIGITWDIGTPAGPVALPTAPVFPGTSAAVTASPFATTGNGPGSLVIDPLGSTFIENYDNGSVSKVSPDGSPTPASASTGSNPLGIRRSP